jgi:diguanylate cyclase (GGDEF)-like protein/PAS domain S-box-containing protein
MNTENNLPIDEAKKENLFHSMLDVMADVSPAMIWMTDENGNCTFANPAWMEFTGLTLECTEQYEWKNLVHPDDRKLLAAYYSDLNSEDSITLEYRLRHADGSWRWVLDVGIPVFSSEHKFCGYMGSAIDIAERKQLGVTNQYYASIVKSSDDAITSKDINGIVTAWNPAAERIFGYTEAEMLGGPMAKLFLPDCHDEEQAIMEKILRNESINRIEVQRLHKNGSLLDVAISVSPIHDAVGNIIGASSIARDITKRKQREKELQQSEAIVRAIVETAFTTIITINSKGIILTANPAVERLFHYKPEELIGFNVKMLMPEPFHSQHDGYLLRYLTEGDPHVIGGVVGREVVGLRKDGGTFPVNLAVSEIKVEGERQFVGILTDMTEQRLNEEMLLEYGKKLEGSLAEQAARAAELYRSEATIRAVLETAITAIVMIDEKGIIQSINPAAERLFQYSSPEIVGANVNILMPEPYHSEHDDYLSRYMEKGQAHIIGVGREVVCKRKDGSVFPADLAVSEIEIEDEHKFVGILTDITQRKKAEKEIEYLAFYDSLTGLPNRRKLLERLTFSIKLSRREGRRFAVFMMDLDKFKAVNDTLGHAAGDDLLKQVATRITARLRDSDLVARLGGDEFVILLEDCPTAEDAEKVATNVIADLTVPFELNDGNVVQIGASIGISFYPKHGDTPEKLTDNADQALYKAKDNGRGCFQQFSL